MFTPDYTTRQCEVHILDLLVLNLNCILCVFGQINVLAQGLYSVGSEIVFYF